MICRACGQTHAPLISCSRARRLLVTAQVALTPKSGKVVLTEAPDAVLTPTSVVLTDRRADRHSPGYQREYQRKRRAAAKAGGAPSAGPADEPGILRALAR